MSSLKILGALAALVLFTAPQESAEAQFYSGEYSTFYQPYTSYYSGPTTAYYGGGSGCCGTGSGYTAYYGGSYGYGGNPFAPLVSSPYGYRGGWFGSGYTAAYGPSGCCNPCGCNPCATGCGYGCATGCGSGCATGNCATGNCSIPAASEQMKPSPDNGVPNYDDSEQPRTFDEGDMPPEDDRGFRRSDDGASNTGTDESLGGFDNEAFKIPTGQEGLEVPEGTSQPDSPLDADKPDEEDEGISVPKVQFDLHGPSPGPITPRNSAQAQPATHLDQRITWRSRPVIVPERQQLTASRPLIVRKTVKVQLNPAPTLVSQSSQNR